MLSIPLCLKDRFDILLESVWSRSRSRVDFKPEPTIGSVSETKDRGHEPDPNLDPRVEDKKLCALSCFVLKTNTCVKHLQKLLVSTSKLCDVTISNVLKDASEKRPWCLTDVRLRVVSNTLPFWVQVPFDTGFSLFFPPTLTTMTPHTQYTTWPCFTTISNRVTHLTFTQTQYISKDTPSILPSRIISWPLSTKFLIQNCMGFKLDMLSIPLCLKDRFDILLESVWSRSRSRVDFKPEPTIGSVSETKDRGHEPDPNLDPRVEDKKLCALSCFVLKTNTCVKHLQKLFFGFNLFLLVCP